MSTINLHFDLNRTVLMSDAAGGRGMNDTLNYLLSEVSWGNISSDKKTWTPVANTSPTSVQTNNQLINYKKFVDLQSPYLKIGDVIPEGHTDTSSFNKMAKAARKNLHGSFTNDDQPGASLRATLDLLISKMSMSTQMQREAAMKMADEIEPGLLADTWRKGQHFLLPSFLQLLIHLQSTKLINTVRIVYRTFGTDLIEVQKELNIMAIGKHPMYPNTILDPRLTIRTPFSTFLRRGPLSSDCYLIKGTHTDRPKDMNANDESIRTFYSTIPNVTVVQGFEAIFNEMSNMIQQKEPVRTSIGIRDHWNYWSANGESDDSGKPLLINDVNDNGSSSSSKSSDQNDDEDRNVFIDDHVEKDHAHIIDVRNISNGSCVAFQDAIGKYMLRAHPYDAILNENYFIDLVRSIVEDVGKKEKGNKHENEGKNSKV